jgi:2-phospho-L-lactate guanylyltransferase
VSAVSVSAVSLAAGWVVVLPVKGGPEAKTRLASPGVVDGGALALAFARDLLGAVRAVPDVLGVIVVSSDAAAREILGSDGASLAADPGQGLNQAAVVGITAARDAHPNAGVVVMLADLPCVTAAEVSTALAAAGAQQRSFVRDAEGTGTTLIAVAPGVSAEPLFGSLSAARHAAAGFVEITLPADARIRLDVDTPEDLAVAVMVGVGPHARAALGG